MSPLIVSGAFLGLLAAGLPIFVVLGAVALFLYWSESFPLVGMAQIMVDRLNSVSVMAVPFFVMAAAFMEKGGIAKALTDAASAWVGHFRGGLALVCVAAAAVFSSLCGSSIATALAIGAVLVPSMLAQRYERPFALGLVGTSATLGVLIPPSMPMIIYSLITEESVLRLFLAGVIPGLIQTAILGMWVIVHVRRHGYLPGTRMTRTDFVRANLRALPALSIPIIVLGGIYGGFVAVTEAAALSALVALIVALLLYRGFRLSETIGLFAESMKRTAAIFFIVIGALVFGHWITGSGYPNVLVEMVGSSGLKGWQFLLIMNILMLAMGMFLDALAVILITVPLVMPLLGPLGIDPVHYCIVLVVNMEIGLLTPPIGLNLFVMSSIAKAPLEEVMRGATPFVLLMLLFLALVTYVPELSTWLPDYVYGPTRR